MEDLWTAAKVKQFSSGLSKQCPNKTLSIISVIIELKTSVQKTTIETGKKKYITFVFMILEETLGNQ